MMGSLIDVQMPLDWYLKNALIAVLPPAWQAARMDLTPHADGVDQAHILISTPEGHAQIVMPTAEMIDDANKLAATFSAHGLTWNRVSYTVTRDAQGQWDYSADYDY